MMFSTFAHAHLDDLARSGAVELTTVDTMRSNLRAHLEPRFGPMPVSEITALDVQLYVVDFSGSRSTLDRTLATMKEIMDRAAVGGYAPRIDFSTIRRPVDQGRIKLDVLAPRHVETIASYAGSSGPIIRFLAYTGLRFGELAGLQTTDLEARPTGMILRVRRALKRTGTLGPPKHHSLRDLYLIEPATRALADWLGDDHDPPPGILFPAPRGGYLYHSNFHADVWKPAIDRFTGDVREHRPRIHDLRHTFASVLLAAGCSIDYVSNQLGHRDRGITERVYAHWLGDDAEHQLDLANRYLAGT